MPAIRSLLLIMLCCSGMYVFPSDSLLIPQKVRNPYNISIAYRPGYGFIIPHHPDMVPYTRNHFKTVEFAVTHQADGRKNWHGAFKYPQTGIAFFYSELSDIKTLGTVAACFPFINFPIIAGKNVSLNLRFGLGAGYFSTKFDTFSNWRNLAIGSQINGTADLYLNLRLRIYHNTFFDAGAGFMHFSNGATFMPNYGINLPTVRAGLSTVLIGKNYKTIETDRKVQIAKPEISFSAAMGYKDDELGTEEGEFVYKGSVNFHYPIGCKSRIIFGFDGDYNYISHLMLDKFQVTYYENSDLIRYWLSIGAELTLPDISLFVKTGYYLQALDQFDGKYPQLIGVRYYFVKTVFCEVALKTHYGKADYLSAGLGFSIIQSK